MADENAPKPGPNPGQPQAQQRKAGDAGPSANPSGTPLTRESIRPAPENASARPAVANVNAPDDAPERSMKAQDAQRAIRLPNARELDEARKAKFGDGPGTIAVDADPEGVTGEDGKRRVEFVFLDERGKEVGREPFSPDAGGDEGEGREDAASGPRKNRK